DKCQVISISGLDRAGLLKRLRCMEPTDVVTTLVLHIGINDCKRGYLLAKKSWRDIISAARRCFPAAEIYMSSILPMNTEQQTDPCVADSNFCLGEVSISLQAKFIDNDCVFYTRTGEVKSSWYRDAIHPNARGSSSLAINVKRAFSGRTPPRQIDGHAVDVIGRGQEYRRSCEQPGPRLNQDKEYAGRDRKRTIKGQPKHRTPLPMRQAMHNRAASRKGKVQPSLLRNSLLLAVTPHRTWVQSCLRTLRGVAVLSSWASLAVTAVKFQHSDDGEVSTENKKDKISCKLFYFLWRVCETGGRVLCIALFASTFENWVFGIVGFHFVVMLVWIVLSGSDDVSAGTAVLALLGVLCGYITVFYMPSHSRPSRYLYLVYYALFYTENFLMLALWAVMTSDRDAWFYIPAIVTVIVLFLLHIVTQLLYYKCFHPKAGDIEWCMNLSGVTSDISTFRLVDHTSTNFCRQTFCAAGVLWRTISREYGEDTGFLPAKFENGMSVLPFSV
ncbi:hypothetical protein BaRGS_00038639, partial [Batillaria attramentaria]